MSTARRLRLLLLTEGDAETSDAWSGSARQLVVALRKMGHEVRTADCELTGWRRALALAMTIAAPRRRWWVRFHLLQPGFSLRSGLARRHVHASQDWADAVLQIGATFSAGDSRLPLFLYCDANIALARRAVRAGLSEASFLSEQALDAVAEREKHVYASANTIFCMSRMLASVFKEAFAVRDDRLLSVHAGINHEFPGTIPSRNRASATILFVGRDFIRKGGPLLLEAFQLLRRQLPEARLLLVGPNEHPAPGAPGIEHLGFLDPGTVSGRDALASAFAQADVFCLPTTFEPLGIAFLEAMSYGLPCVGPAAWAVPEMIEDGVTGRLIHEQSAEGYATALRMLLLDRQLREQMGAAARIRVMEYFRWERVAADISARVGTVTSVAVE